MLVDFCLPAKDEEEILEANALRLYDYLNSLQPNYNWRLVILINGSSDNSYAIAQDLVERYPNSFKALNYEAGGKSRTLKQYFPESEADILAFLDIDLAVAPKDIPNLINPLLANQADLVIGSRFLKTAKTSRSALRELSSHNYNRLARLIFKNKITDLQCGFKAFKKEVFQNLEPYFQDNRWFFDAELIMLALKFGYKIQEIPVSWEENRFFKRLSKVKKGEAWYFVKRLLELKKYLNTLEIKQ